MRIGWVLLFASVMIAAVCWFTFRGDSAMPDAGAVVAPAVSAPIEGERIETADTHVERNPALDIAHTTSTTTAGAVERTRVIGRCVDEKGIGLAGVELTLDAPGQPWSKAEDAPLLEGEGSPKLGFRAQSGEDGRFRFDVPQPDASPIQLVAVGGLDRQEMRREVEHRFQGRPAGGEVDLGDVVLAVGARIEGTVKTSSGKPVAGARVTALHAPASCTARSNASGRYAIGHLPAGRWPLEAQSSRFLTKTHPEIEVSLGGAALGVDLVLEDAPVLSGRVVDPSQRPIAQASVLARPDSASGIDQTVTAEDGTFTLFLRTQARRPRKLEVSKQGWIRNAIQEKIPENTTDIVVVMQPAPRMTFRVVDGETKAPIERYRIQLVRADDSTKRMDGRAVEEEHPNGEVVLEAVRYDHAVLLAVKGRAPVQTLIEPDEPGGLVQTIPTFPESHIVGRIVLDGAPAPGVEVHVVRVSMGPLTTKPGRAAPTGADAESAKRRRWLGPGDWPARDRYTMTDASGAFRFDELGPGTWNVSLRGSLITTKTIEPVALGHGSLIDLGEIQLATGCSILGHVVVPSGLDPRYVEVDLNREIKVRADEHGDFRIEGLEPGKYVLRVEPNTLLALGGAMNPVELAPGEQKRIELDLRESNLARVRVRLKRGHELCSGPGLLIVYATPQHHVGGYSTPSTGETELLAHPRVAFRVVAVEGGFPVARSDALTMQPGQRYDLDLSIETGRLEVQLPDHIAVPESGQLSIVIADGPYQYHRTARAPSAKSASQIDWTSNRLVVCDLAPGEYEVQASSYATRGTKGLQLQGRARIVVGETCVVAMSEK